MSRNENNSAESPVARTSLRRFADGQLGAIAHRYLASGDHTGLSDTYRRTRELDIERLLHHRGGRVAVVPVAALAPAHVESHLDELTGNPARERLKTLRALSRTARRLGYIRSDFCVGVSRTQPATAGYRPWDLEDVAAFRARWPYGTEQRVAFEVLYWCGCRISDGRRLGPDHVDAAGWLAFVQQKTGGPVYVPFARELPEFAVPEDLDHLKAAIAAMGNRPGTYVQRQGGGLRSPKASSNWFSDAAREAGVKPNRTAHGLRKTRMILHAERGATQEQIAAWSGHEDLRIAHYYAREASKKRILSPRAEVLAHPDIVDRLHARLVETLKAEAKAAADKARRRRR